VRPNNSEQKFTEAQIIEAARAVLEELRSSPDTEELAFYRAAFRKSVPFAMRSYFAGYLLKRLLQSRQKHKHQAEEAMRMDQDRRHERKKSLSERNKSLPKPPKEEARQGKGSFEKVERAEKPERQEKRERPPREKNPPLPPEVEAATLFFGAGKKRRCYQEHVLAIFVEDGGIDKSQIGEIRSFDNYSFVQIAQAAADEAIAALNGFEYRGRKITVSYARKKDETPASRREEPESRDSFGDRDARPEEDSEGPIDGEGDEYAESQAEDEPGDEEGGPYEDGPDSEEYGEGEPEAEEESPDTEEPPEEEEK
jgi:hypothetical protein